MGGEVFSTKAKGKTVDKAFSDAKEKAFYDHGHSGYTGTIAEKEDFTVLVVPEGIDAEDYADLLILTNDRRVTDKWGPAGAV